MWLEQRLQAMPQLHLGDQQFNRLLKCVRCDMAFIEPMHGNKPNITYLLT